MRSRRLSLAVMARPAVVELSPADSDCGPTGLAPLYSDSLREESDPTLGTAQVVHALR